ncbi:ATP-binding domain-containing protein [Hyphobacterium sp.]|uniref:ATP-binding domain-containing protein n=1 Tax=Hyphobacterium sp. TaxID=2004662 RepID=UPI003B51FE26
MTKTNKDALLHEIASDALQCIERVADDAERAKNESRNTGPSAFASINTFNSPEQVNRLTDAAAAEWAALSMLIKQPVIARVTFVDEDDRETTIFISRGTPRSIPGYKIASYLTPLGRIATLAAGDEDTFSFRGVDREVSIQNNAKLNLRRSAGHWDSIDSEIDVIDQGSFTIRSFRELIDSSGKVGASDLEALWDDDADIIVAGVRRAILSKMGLRDQPVLDRYQDDIFRMPIITSCFLSGPPGTGKTTTLIRRLGQKVDREALVESGENTRLIDTVEKDTGHPHAQSWIVFSPTELLRQYVKEAFNREGLPASDRHIRTWDEYRREISRDNLGLLRTSSGAGPFVERKAQDHLQSSNSDDVDWYEDFWSFVASDVRDELISDAVLLGQSAARDLRDLGPNLSASFQRIKGSFYPDTIREVERFRPDIVAALDVRHSEIAAVMSKFRNRLVYEDRDFPIALQAEVSRLAADEWDEAEEEDELDAALTSDDEQALENQTARTVSRRQALAWLERAVRSLAKARFAGRKPSKNSRNSKLLSWLGGERTPSEDVLLKLGKLLDEQLRLRKFERLERLFIRGIAPRYKKFRAERSKIGKWYSAEPPKRADVHWRELDLIILATLQIGNELLSGIRSRPAADLPTTGSLGAIRYLQRAQLLVDEATDFSRIQLACMRELTHPSLRSLFLCGDVNQRLTPWGVRSNEALSWIDPNIVRKSITVSYRQSQRLVELAKDIAAIGGSEPSDIVLPDRLDMEGLPPVWQTHLSTNELIADWLNQRIREIDNTLQRPTTIAVLANHEHEVEPLALALDARLEEINLRAVACKDGKVVGNDRDVRVFNIRHIKGLEFEAVFFVDLDQTVDQFPDLFAKFLYVGATRAATYLGLTFSGDIPTELMGISDHFEGSWEQ